MQAKPQTGERQNQPETHQVTNQPRSLVNYNAFTSDPVLQAAVERGGASWAQKELEDVGGVCGREDIIQLGFQANENSPKFRTHDSRGRRIDEVDYHPAYHQLWQLSREHGGHNSVWVNPQPGAHVARAAKGYMINQVDAGHGCPVTMTFASVPLIQSVPSLAETWMPLIINSHYDPSNSPINMKKGATIGMAITEKQGGSDVREITTNATPIGPPGEGRAYELVGHKYFVSAPMSDAFLMMAKTEEGPSCFLVPRWLEDGTKNPIQLQQLKLKMGNVSNATAEAELRGALGWLIGPPGKGIKTILKSIALTRFDCVVGSTAGIRQATIQAVHHCRQRSAFGNTLSKQPLMQNVLADLSLESAGALTLMIRLATALDHASKDENEAQFLRLATALGKYWVCKRQPYHAYEALECIGGSGVMEDGIMPRLYREAPINAIWEGSGNIQALDVLRTLWSSPLSLEVYLNELQSSKGNLKEYDRYIEKLEHELSNSDNIEYRGRAIVEQMALALQASTLIKSDNDLLARSFCQSRLGENQHLMYGTLPEGIHCKAIVQETLSL